MSVSLIYFANVLGSTAGPIITGFILLDELSFSNNVRILSILTLLASVSVFILSEKSGKYRTLAILSFVGIIGFEFVVHKSLYNHLYEKLYFKHNYHSNKEFTKTIETRSGVINIAAEKSGGDIIVGGGTYDGRFNTDLVADTNIISRAYMFAALHPNPETVLEIGLSGGAWGIVISGYKKVSSLDIVEINSGYIELVASYLPYINLLRNPKVNIHLDDARRWLLRNPKKNSTSLL